MTLWDILNYSPGEDTGLINTDSFVNWVHTHIVSTTQFFQEILMTTPTVFMTTEGFWFVYRQTTKLSIVILFIVFCDISVRKLLGKRVDTNGLLEKVMAYAILTKVGPHIMIKVIELFNRIVAILIKTQDGIVPAEGTGSSLAIIFFLVVFIVMVLRLLLFYFERLIWLIFYTIIIPVVLALRCSVRFKHLGSNLTGEIMNLLVVKVAHALVLLILGTIIMGVSELDPFLALGCQIGALSSMTKMEEKIITFFAGCAAKYNAPDIHEGLERYQKYYSQYSSVKRVATNIKFIKKLFGGW